MSELRALLASSAALRQAGRPFVLATVVGVQGSSYRRPGARLILADDAVVAGSVSAGCLEADLVRRGWWRTDQRDTAVVTYDSVSSDDELGWGLGLGCNGVVDLLLERAGAGLPDPLAWHARCLAAEQTGCLVTVVRSGDPAIAAPARLALDPAGRVVEGEALLDPGPAPGGRPGPGAPAVIAAGPARAWLLEQARRALGDGVTRAVRSPDGALGALVEVIAPPPALFVIGTHPDAVPVAAQARALGWRVVVVADQSRWETRQRFAGDELAVLREPADIRAAVDACARPAAVVMSHDFERDRAALGALLGSSARYIGVLGPRRRTEQLLAAPGPDGRAPGPGALERLHAPAGLHLGAETPAEIALAIVAEAQAVLSGSSGCSLRDRVGPIHGASAVAGASPGGPTGGGVARVAAE